MWGISDNVWGTLVAFSCLKSERVCNSFSSFSDEHWATSSRVVFPFPRAAVFLEKAVCSLVCVVLLSSTHLVLCPAHTSFGFSNGRVISFMQKGYNGIGVPNMCHSKVNGALTQKKRALQFPPQPGSLGGCSVWLLSSSWVKTKYWRIEDLLDQRGGSKEKLGLLLTEAPACNRKLLRFSQLPVALLIITWFLMHEAEILFSSDCILKEGIV